MSTDLTYRLYIDGSWADSEGGEPLHVRNPATEEQIGLVPNASAKDVVRAITAARAAFDSGPWPRMTPRERSAVMVRMAEALDRRRDEFVDLVVAEAGALRPLAFHAQVGTGISHFTDIAERVLPTFPFSEAMLPEPGLDAAGPLLGQGVVLREPRGVAALITPFNFPFLINLCKLAPALAAGNTVVLKPSPLTPLEALVLGEIADEAGLPPGVLNIVTGDVAAGEELTRNPMVDLISFTGSDLVGRKVMAQGADTLKKVILELGGKSANLLFEDADVDRAAVDVLTNFVMHAGQGCALLTRTLVHESLHDELVSKVTAMLPYVKLGDPADPTTGMGPLISAAQRERVERLISIGSAEGGRIVYGGGRPADLDKGYYLEPTLFVDVDHSMTITRREIFGPVGVVIPFRDQEEAIRLANDSDYGLGGGVWSADTIRAFEVAKQLRTGYIHVNGGGGSLTPHGPFGGYKQSGLGREVGYTGMSEFLEYKTINWRVG
ncbi:aldehyde dehydrogenase family protein [Frankia sp. CNm7]|uniref:Aldehyde dehydrogenase family protein n=1 Tax=Frankia nepalensis TaxID=1836974 RepID=A0A937RLW1_9ACTN|nr:aldehyde dehydrogenase family protein [Frankia nepalensis]MBL7500985.1 aldehyde dehydrogenase family protein [Frankia nepalensis]MBL7512469.1 aldehyde dehydrogenase family protein [Frankia nepalensis]MBL7521535.1 aldehyde dehydrogenase family protein [Frankia nepalensis]MBL7632772.1 aldehyde dehydrogenase family protein [Frankia nepalensis]